MKWRDINNYLNCYIIKNGKINKCKENRVNPTYDGLCGLLNNKLIGYFVYSNNLFLLNDGKIVKINPNNVFCKHEKIDVGYNLHIICDNIDVINLDYIPFEDNLYYGDEEPNIAEKLEQILSTKKNIQETIELYENYGKNYVK